MHFFHSKNNIQGFTLLENLIIVTIVVILAATAAPSFLGMHNKAKVNNAVNTVRGALQEAQRQAISKSISCTVTLNTTAQKITSSNGCLLTGDRTLPNGVNLAVSDGNTINYSIRGNTNFSSPTSNTNKIIISLADGSQQKCLEVSKPLGIIRSGIYNGTDCNKP